MNVQPAQNKPATLLYYARAGSDDDGEDYSLIVEATSLDEAAKLWAEYYEIGTTPSLFQGTDHVRIKRVYVIPATTGVAHALSWGTMPLYERTNILGVPGWAKI